MTRIISYVMQKLKSLGVKSTKAIQLLEILTALCICKGVPVKQNQSKILAYFYAVSGVPALGLVIFLLGRLTGI